MAAAAGGRAALSFAVEESRTRQAFPPTASPPRAAIFGAGHGTTYPRHDSSGFALAADGIRAASQEDAGLVAHWDFDLGGPLSRRSA